MNKFVVDMTVRDFAAKAKRREKSHRRGINVWGLLVGLAVPAGVIANGVTPGFTTLLFAFLLAWPTHKIVRRLSRNRTQRLYVDLAESFRENFPQETGHYKPALYCLIGLRPKTDVVTKMLDHLPGADTIIAETADGTVSFADDSGKPTESTAKGKTFAIDGVNSLHQMMKSLGMPPMAGLQTEEELMEFLKAHPNAQATITESSTGKGGFVKTVKIVGSTTTATTTMNAKKPATTAPQAATTPETLPPPETQTTEPESPGFIPLDPYASAPETAKKPGGER